MMDYTAYQKQLRGCFVGKAVGGTLGMPLEGYIGTKKIEYYDPIPFGMVENDDLDLQVVWMEVIRSRGLPINRKDLADGWVDHIRALPDEYGVVIRNLESGLYPPLSGFYDNKFYAGMGAAIRTELWAALAPGDPDLAVRFAREDACADHYADGVEASTFLTAIESAAFAENDCGKLIETGLSYLDSNGRLHRAIISTIQWLNELKDPFKVREKILSSFFAPNWTDVAINLSFIVLSWLISEGDFSKGICTAASLGHDADCTTATVGAIMGLINPDGIEERWTKPLGDALVLSSSISNMHEVATIQELCEQIGDLCSDVLAYYGSKTQFTVEPEGVNDFAKPWADSAKALYLEGQYDHLESLVSNRPLTVKLRYPDQVAIAPGETAVFKAKISNPNRGGSTASLTLRASDGWRVMPSDFHLDIEDGHEETIEFSVTAPSKPRRRVAKNHLYFYFRIGNLHFDMRAGLIQTKEFLRIKQDYSSDECPPDSLFAKAELVSASAHFQGVPDGQHLFATELRAPVCFPEAVLIVQGTRPIKVWYDGKLILDHDGCEYVPAFHRSDYVSKVSLDGGWHRLVIWTGERGRQGKDKDINRSPNAAFVTVPGSMSTFELRKKYDAQKLYNGEQGEMFLGIANRWDSHWLSEIEWRIPNISFRETE